MAFIRSAGIRRTLGLTASLAILSLGTACATDSTHARGEHRDENLASSGALGLGAFVSNLVYAPLKLLFATGGVLAGGATWAFSGGDSDLAAEVIRPALTGDYVLTPRHLRGLDQIEFVGRAHAAHTYASDSQLPPVSAGGPIQRSTCATAPDLARVSFDVDESRLGRDDQGVLRQVARALATCPNERFRIEGHTDADGEGNYNFNLSLRRAQSVKEFLVREGVEPWRLEATGRGESDPVSSNDTESGRAANRRVEITAP